MAKYWWQESKEKANETIFGVVRHLDKVQAYRTQKNLRNMRLYGNAHVAGLAFFNYSDSGSQSDRLTYNIIQSACDTVHQKIAKNKPKPTFLTKGGDRAKKQMAKKLEKFVLGQFYGAGVYEKAPDIFLDALIFGTGLPKLYRIGKEIYFDRTFVEEIKVADYEAIHGDPRSLYQVKAMPREVVAGLWPGFAQQIKNAKRVEGGVMTHASLTDLIYVVEAWHLPSKKDKSDGKHVICIENQTLRMEGYEKNYFPFPGPMRWKKPRLGWFGEGLADELTGDQYEINKTLLVIQRAFHLFVPKLVLKNGSKIVKTSINNEVGGIIETEDDAPQLWAPAPIAPELFQHLKDTIDRAYAKTGVSMTAAQSRKPAGLDSGKALREFNDIESERYVLVCQAYEQFFMEIARQMIDLAKEIAEEFPDYSVKVKSKSFVETIKWSEIDLKEDEYELQIFPTSMLSETPSGRLSDVQELMQAGFIDKANGLRLMDFPDLESYMSMANAAIEDIEGMIDRMLDSGKYEQPEPYQWLGDPDNPQAGGGIPMVQSAYLRAKNEGVEEDRLELLRRWMGEAADAVRGAKAKAAAAANPNPQAQPGVQGGQPQAVPQAPPTSNLLPAMAGGAA
jgi:hypothetical protein